MFRAASFNNWRRAAFAAVSIASATAFVATSTARHPQHHPPELPSFRPGAVSCQPSAQPTTAWKVEESDSFHYELMHIPPRATESSHIIFGQIMRNGCIEKYDVYKRVNHNLNDDSPELVVADIQLGSKLDGHEGVVHGGIVALLFDDCMGFGFWAMGVQYAVTANLSVDYRAPVPADSRVLVRVRLSKQEGRKLYFTAQMTNLDGSVLYAEATSLYIIPRHMVKNS